MESSELQMQEGKRRGFEGYRLLPERSPQPRNAGIFFGWEIVLQKAGKSWETDYVKTVKKPWGSCP